MPMLDELIASLSDVPMTRGGLDWLMARNRRVPAVNEFEQPGPMLAAPGISSPEVLAGKVERSLGDDAFTAAASRMRTAGRGGVAPGSNSVDELLGSSALLKLPLSSMAAANPYPESGYEMPDGAAPGQPPVADIYPETARRYPTTNDPASGEPEVYPEVSRRYPAAPQLGPTDVSSADARPAGAPLSFAPAGPAPAAAEGGGVLSGLKGAFGNLTRAENAPLLLALASGFAGAPSIGTGMRRAFGAAAPVSMQNIQLQTKLGGQQALFNALRGKGVPAADALAAALDPNVAKAVAGKYFETKALTHYMVKDALGNETPYVFDPNTGKSRPVTVEGGSADGGTTLGASQVYAPGVTKLDPNRTGDEMLAQYHPDVQAAVKAYMGGDVLPSGNPRMRSISDLAKRVAIRYGQDMGIPVSDALFSEKRKYRQELGSNSANSAGGQAKAFNQGIEHAGALATKLEALKNVDPVGIPGVARGLNWMREAFSTKQSSIAKEASAIGQTLAGEVGKLFSGSAGGGVHERELTRNRFNTINSPAELAGALEATLETMEGGLKALEQRRDQILGPNSNVELVNAETRGKMQKIRETIARLKGEADAPAAAPATTSTKVPWRVLQ